MFLSHNYSTFPDYQEVKSENSWQLFSRKEHQFKTFKWVYYVEWNRGPFVILHKVCHFLCMYDSFSDVGESSVWWRADFQSGSRVLKKVFWTSSYLYLWHTMWFHAKKSLKTLKFWKSLNLLCKSGSRPQKSPKKAQKTDHSIAIYSIFGIGMVYFGCLMSRRFRVSVAKGGRGYFRPSYGRPKFTLFSKKKYT